MLKGCGSTQKQHLEENRNQRVVSLGNYDGPSSQQPTKSFINSNLPLNITTLNYSYVVVPFSKGNEQELEQQEHKFKRKSAFEWFQKYANKIRRYQNVDDVDSLSFNLNSYNIEHQGRRNSNYKDVITSKRNDSWTLNYHPSVSKSNLAVHSSFISQNKNPSDNENKPMTRIDNKIKNENYSHQSNLITKAGLYKSTYRGKRESTHLDNNGARHDKTLKETKHSKSTKRRKSRKHGRMYFDKKESSANVTILNGQTAFLTCIVRNVGNKSVSSYTILTSVLKWLFID